MTYLVQRDDSIMWKPEYRLVFFKSGKENLWLGYTEIKVCT